MRLIHVETKRLKEFVGRSPPYAILSHTWSDSEVTYDDMLTGNGTKKLGWRKIEETCRQAREDGLQYAWVDTCCINKESSSELSESINSMFRWYREAAICYAFLQDARRTASTGQDVLELWPNFQRARWFRRGWTLQELLAPAGEFRFYGEDWQLIGTREELAIAISQATDIDRDAIYGRASAGYIRHASIARKMSWASNRETTREEDIAYSLLGLFDVNMPLLYGEGGSRAFERLQEEIIKRGTDHSFLVWGAALDARKAMSNNNNIDFLARHPKDFSGCGPIMKSGEQVAPFALNNLGLQMRLPVYRVSKWKAD
ncbi:heterokaryon incompatibility protein-domain-containing protein, partial [Paraphoma chrysanthemicola]